MKEVNKNKFYVYVYKDPETLIPFYIGKGKGSRDISHISEAKKAKNPRTHKLRKIKKILNSGKIPIVERFQDNMSEGDAYELEKTLIEYYGRLDDGGVLTNVAKGGLQSFGGGNKFNSETIVLYHFDGSMITATRSELISKYGLKGSAVTRLFQGKLKNSKGWSVDKNSPARHRLYHFRNNKTGEQVLMRPSEFANYIKRSTGYISTLVKGNRKHIDHWCIDYEGETEHKDQTTYEFKNINTCEVLKCTIEELAIKLGVNYSQISRIVNTMNGDHNRNTTRGWGLLSKINQSTNKITKQMDMQIYKFIHKNGEGYVGTQNAFRKKFKLLPSCVSCLVRGKNKSTNGWSLESED